MEANSVNVERTARMGGSSDLCVREFPPRLRRYSPLRGEKRGLFLFVVATAAETAAERGKPLSRIVR
jgi:hypothetical protein